MKPLNLSENAPWKQRFRAAKITAFQLAAQNPQRGLVVSNQTGVLQLYAWDRESNNLKQLTFTDTGVANGSIAADGSYLYYFHDEGGNETGHYYRVPFTGGQAQDITPEMPLYTSFGLREIPDGSGIIFNAVVDGMFRFYLLPQEGHSLGDVPQLLWENPALSFGPISNQHGDVLLIMTTERSGTVSFGLRAVDSSGEKIAELHDEQGSIEVSSGPQGSFAPLSKDDWRVLATNDASGYPRPFIWDIRSGAQHPLDLGTLSGAVHPLAWSPDGQRILLQQIDQAAQQLYLYDMKRQQLQALQHPPGNFFGAQFTPQGNILVGWHNAEQPPCLLELDGSSGQQQRVVLSAGEVPAGATWQSTHFPSSDGTMIQAWLMTPDGGGPFPTILEMHGGPTAVESNGFNAEAQTWVDHGFAFMTVNYRGSTTFGQAFERAIWQNLGNLEVEDIVAARQWLVDNGIAQADSVLLTGWSYGGYLTLQSLGKKPGLWAGGMAGVAIADWATMYEDEAETLRGYQRGLFGGSPQETPELHRSASPITYAEQVDAPVLVIQGSNDTRCPARQMRGYEEKMRALGKNIQVHWFDAGHGSRAAEQQIEHQELMLRFAYQVLG